MTAFLAAITLLILAPGANMLMILSLASSAGAAAARRAAFGLTVGVCCHTLAAATGVTYLVQQWPAALRGIQFGGGLVLLWIGGSMIAAQFRTAQPAHAHQQARRSAFVQGLVSSLSNVKTLVLFVSFLPQFFDAAAPIPSEYARYGLAYAAVTLLIYTTIGAVAGRFAATLEHPTVGRWLRICAGVVIAGFGVGGVWV